MGGVDTTIPVNAYIPGCPPRPEAIIDGVVKLLSSLKQPQGAMISNALELDVEKLEIAST